jgi:transposase
MPIQRELTDEQWLRIEPYLPSPKASPKGGPKPKSARDCFEGILWILRTGSRWKDLPDCFPSPSTCWRRLREWDEKGAWEAAWHAFLDELSEKDRGTWEVVFADAMFVPAKKGATASVKPSAAKERSWLWWAAAKAFLWHSWSPRPRRRPRK